MAGSQSVNDVLRGLHGLFRSCLNFQSISPQLRQRNLLTDYEWQVIKSKDSHEDQVDEFLNYLPFKGKDCLNQLIECLRSSSDHLGHQDILTELEAELIKRVDRDNLEDQTEVSLITPPVLIRCHNIDQPGLYTMILREHELLGSKLVIKHERFQLS